ncbi:hypothetical protein ACFP3I_03755 [Chryseobacterium arachidis]
MFRLDIAQTRETLLSGESKFWLIIFLKKNPKSGDFGELSL